MDKVIAAGQVVWQAATMILTNRMVWTCFAAWFIASFIKVMIFFGQQGRFDFRILVGTGGMPSSHSAFVSCLATVIGLEAGWDSPVFMLALGFAIVTMNDAQGVRRASGQQASILNRIVDDMYRQSFKPERLKELLGHTPVQVMAGGLIGIACGLLFYI